MARRQQHLAITVLLALAVFVTISYFFTSSSTDPSDVQKPPRLDVASKSSKSDDSKASFDLDLAAMPLGLLEGESIAPKLENATLK